MEHPDFLIVGGGSAGATLASLLSEDPATRVLLIEAGADTPPQAIPTDIADTFPSSSLNPDYFWPGLQAAARPGDTPRPYPQARVMGGGSSVMGMWALRGLRSDFDRWAAAGAEGWGSSEVVRCFRRLEDDADRDRTQREAGSYPIRRVPPQEWPAFVTAIERAAAARGLPHLPDINESERDGFFPMPLGQDAQRASSARCYLTASVRRRSNLAVLARTRVTGLRLEGGAAAGVEIERGGARERLDAREVVLCAGAIFSPAMLLRAGIGPADELSKIGITPHRHLPGVGRNLQNHPYLHFALTLPRGMRLKAHLRRFAIAGIRLSSGAAGCPAGDLLLFMIGRVSPRPHGPDLAMLGAALYAPFSRGEVSLAGADIEVPPRIEFRLLADPRDPPRMLAAARFAQALLLDRGVAATYSEAFLLPPLMSLHQFNRPGFSGSLLALAAKALLNAPAAVRRAAIGRAIRPGRWFADRRRQLPLADAELLAAAAPMAHPVGTCAIGRAEDAAAVVDSSCRVHGLRNLRVVDASIMPGIPSANTNLPTLMIAHRAAELIRSQIRA
ncbi:MAG TPA: GMC family oxidoreductase [Xanthobacteraceae bacterium]